MFFFRMASFKFTCTFAEKFRKIVKVDNLVDIRNVVIEKFNKAPGFDRDNLLIQYEVDIDGEAVFIDLDNFDELNERKTNNLKLICYTFKDDAPTNSLTNSSPDDRLTYNVNDELFNVDNEPFNAESESFNVENEANIINVPTGSTEHWPHPFIIFDYMVRSDIIKRLDKGAIPTQSERQILLGGIYDRCSKFTL